VFSVAAIGRFGAFGIWLDFVANGQSGTRFAGKSHCPVLGLKCRPMHEIGPSPLGSPSIHWKNSSQLVGDSTSPVIGSSVSGSRQMSDGTPTGGGGGHITFSGRSQSPVIRLKRRPARQDKMVVDLTPSSQNKYLVQLRSVESAICEN